MKKIVNLFSNLITYLTIFIVLAVSIFVIPTFIGIKPFIVQSGSMEPAINTGAIAFVNTKNKNVQLNDIITFKLVSESGKETVVTHRIVDIQNEFLYTKGDANENTDLSPIKREQVIGKFVIQIPYIGYFMASMSKKKTIVVVVWIMLLNFISITLSSVFNNASDMEVKDIKK